MTFRFDMLRLIHIGQLLLVLLKVRTIVTLAPADHRTYRLKLRHLNFDPYYSRTRAGP